MLHVQCHMSCVMCHMSCVTFFSFSFYMVVELVGGGSVITWAYSVKLSYLCAFDCNTETFSGGLGNGGTWIMFINENSSKN